MRAALTWPLIATVVLTGFALWGGEVPRVVSAIEPRLRESTGVPDFEVRGATTPSESLAPLPTELRSVAAEPAKRDVFAPFSPTPPSVSPVPQPALAVATPAQPPPPQPPAINLRFLGSMISPTGERLVYLARGDSVLPVAVGDRVDEGYVVTELAADAVTLTYPPLEARVVVPISQPAQP